MKLHALLTLLAAAYVPTAFGQPASVVNSPHNLSSSGPGSIHAAAEDEVCIFCHTPHNSSPVRPLWNRNIPTEAYTVYTSRALTALPGQPTGMSKLCLSCHDGTIALGNVLSRDTPIAMAGGVTTIPQGSSRLGTNLSDDHPISFRYDSSISAHNPKVKNPSALPPEVQLDANSELQCTSCHDAHNNSLGNFMVMHNENSQLCIACHQMGTTSVLGHNQCSACHQPHTAPSGPYLLRRATISQTCLACHDGTVALAPNIASQVSKISSHDTASPVDPSGPAQDHATCADCHEPHTMMTGSVSPPNISPNMGIINGVTTSGGPIANATAEYEVCFKCHADNPTGSAWVSRVATELNTRLEFSTSAASFHPVAGPGRNTSVPSLKPGWTTSSRIGCTDCHGSNTSRIAGGTGPDGIHGSIYAPNLILQYSTTDYTTESAQAYALCYRCHDRSSILNDQSFKEHRKHIVSERAPCAACHDAHGISSLSGNTTNNSNLINFSTSIVRPSSNGQLRFVDTGNRSGQCFLNCHGENHNPLSYSP